MKPIFEMLAGYSEWANRRLYDAAAGLDDADFRADYGAFFGSVHGTLNHLLVGDRVWMHRSTGEGPSPARLDEILYEDFAGLRAAREQEDARIAPMSVRLHCPTSTEQSATTPSAILTTSSRS
jgi:uncharacterized damage-inducible protein DinB